jgi:hypothetical protein
MDYKHFHYISPKIIPTFPENIGKVRCLIDVSHILRTRAYKAVSGNAQMKIELFSGGESRGIEEHEVPIADGVSQMAGLMRCFSTPEPGYVEISFQMPEPVFVKILPEPGYAILETPRGSITLNPDMKYANPRTIQQIKHYGRFSMLHSAVMVNSATGSGNSILLVNPYERAVNVRLTSASGKELAKRIVAKTSELVSLEPIVEHGVPSTVFVTSSNRVITYDVKHAYSDQGCINNIDHLDPFSGYRTHEAHGYLEVARYHVRELARKIGLRHA